MEVTRFGGGIVKMTINTETLSALIAANKNDKETLDFIYNGLLSFESYHRSVFEMEIKIKLYANGTLSREEYQDMVSSADKSRTAAHNSLLATVSALNRLAVNNGLPPLYDGEVSEDRIARREVADAVFAYVQTVIDARR